MAGLPLTSMDTKLAAKPWVMSKSSYAAVIQKHKGIQSLFSFVLICETLGGRNLFILPVMRYNIYTTIYIFCVAILCTVHTAQLNQTVRTFSFSGNLILTNSFSLALSFFSLSILIFLLPVSLSASACLFGIVQLARYDMEVRQRCWLVLSKRQQEESTQRERRQRWRREGCSCVGHEIAWRGRRGKTFRGDAACRTLITY